MKTLAAQSAGQNKTPVAAASVVHEKAATTPPEVKEEAIEGESVPSSASAAVEAGGYTTSTQEVDPGAPEPYTPPLVEQHPTPFPFTPPEKNIARNRKRARRLNCSAEAMAQRDRKREAGEELIVLRHNAEELAGWVLDAIEDGRADEQLYNCRHNQRSMTK